MVDTSYLERDDFHPIDLVEQIAEQHQWDFDRVTDDQIAMLIEGQWRSYSITLAWSNFDETLRLICTYSMDPPEKSEPNLFELLNSINDRCWSGAFTWWKEQGLMVYRYGLIQTGQEFVESEQVDTMINAAVTTCEQYYPAIQLVTWADNTPETALQTAIGGTFGRA